jgi:hypothetical protein
MLARVLRLPGWVLGLLAAAALVAHGIALRGWPGPPGTPAVRSSGALLALLLAGRILLALLPPGEVGGHSPRALPATLSVSLLLGVLWSAAVSGLGPVPWGLLGLAGIARVWTLPGAMVPRHRVPSEPTPLLDAAAGLAGAALVVAAGVSAVVPIAASLCLFHALRVARRAAPGPHAFLVLGAATELHPPAAGLALVLGASFLVPWLRRADRRAGALAALALGTTFLGGPGPLPIAAALVLVLASHPRQRAFAAAWVGATGAACAARAWLAPLGATIPEDRRLLAFEVLRDAALETETWGLAWPILLSALLLGLLAFRWREVPWEKGRIDPPRREALAVGALFLAGAAAIPLPASPWLEGDALQMLFAPAALLAGLLLIPSESARGA